MKLDIYLANYFHNKKLKILIFSLLYKLAIINLIKLNKNKKINFV